MLWDGEALQTNITGVCGGARSAWATLGLPALMVCVLSQSKLLRLQVALQKLSKSGPALHALPRSKPLRLRFSGTPQRCRLGWACIFCPSQVRATQVTRCLVSAHSLPRWSGASYHLPGPSLSVSRVRSGSAISAVSCFSFGELISGCDPAGGCQPSRTPGRLS